MLWNEQFDSKEEFLEAAPPPPAEYETVREMGYDAAAHSFAEYVDINDLSTVDPLGAARHSEEYHEPLTEELGRPPTKEEMLEFLDAYESEYQHRMVKAGIVGDRQGAKAWAP